MLEECSDPIICETHGGTGRLWQACYSHIERGIVFEKAESKVAVLAKQRPMWSVYQCDVVPALEAGFGSHLEVNFLDVDPYGDPHPVIDAFLASERPRPEKLCLAVNDGLRNKLRLTGGWDAESVKHKVAKYGNGLARVYLEVCEEMLKEKAAQAGYDLSRFWGYYATADLTHYAAVLSWTGGSS